MNLSKKQKGVSRKPFRVGNFQEYTMTKLLLIITLILFAINSFGQEDKKMDPVIEAEIKKLSTDFKSAEDINFTENEKVEKIKSEIYGNSNPEIGTRLKKQLEETQKIKDTLDSIYTSFLAYKRVYLNKGIPEKTIDSLFNHKYTIISQTEQITKVVQPQKTYIYFGKDKVIAENDNIFTDKTANLIFKDILEAKSEAYLGDFIIPRIGQLIKLKTENINTSVYFKNIKIHIVEGCLYDIQLFVTDAKNNELLFENKSPISLLKATKLFPINYLSFRTATSNDKDIALDSDDYCSSQIKLSDALVYVPNPGDNYVPEDLTLEFPTKTNGVPDNNSHSIRYKVNQNTSLQNIVELRAYTDFLGLFSDAPNGIVQLEGKADFFISPFNVPNVNLYFLKKIAPFVHFSRIEKNVRNLSLVGINDSTSTIKTSLEILEKSYLKMGLNLSIVTYKLTKEYPFDINLYATAKYQISDVLVKDSLQVNYKSLGLGGGLAFEFKRYNNFGFICSADFTNYNVNSFNEIKGFVNPDNFLVFKTEAEVYYFPSETKNKAIFLRFKTFNNSTKNNNEAFYQLQFGYRFAIGVSKLKQ